MLTITARFGATGSLLGRSESAKVEFLEQLRRRHPSMHGSALELLAARLDHAALELAAAAASPGLPVVSACTLEIDLPDVVERFRVSVHVSAASRGDLLALMSWTGTYGIELAQLAWPELERTERERFPDVTEGER